MIVEKDGQKFIQEGKALIQTKKVTQMNDKIVEEEVFYNPAQIYNRDLTVLAIDTFAQGRPPIVIVDALSASGLRSVRYAQEIQNVKEIYANDISLASLSMIEENIKLNSITNVKTNHMDANKLMMQGIHFDVIDLDPYGTVAPFLESSLQACDDTLLCITCTDSRVLCGPDQQKCFSTYGTARVKMNCFAENGLRSLLYSISAGAGRMGKTMKPLLSIYGEFYLRVFTLISKDKKGAHKLISQVGNVFVCTQCYAFYPHPYGQAVDNQFKTSKQAFPGECQICSSPLRLNGPVWLGEMNCKNFVNEMQKNMVSHHGHLQTFDKINGKLTGILEGIECPYSYNICSLASLLKSSNLSKKEIYSAFQSLGYQVTQSYLQREEYKTDAPPQVVYDIVKSYIIPKKPKIEAGSVADKILNTPIVHIPDFTKKVLIPTTKMFYPDPPNWGPKSRAIQKKEYTVEPEKKNKLE